jgi:uncharacterized protein
MGLSGRNLLRWLNHQVPGNARFDGFDLYALRPIACGEEITFDYTGGDAEPAAKERVQTVTSSS